MKHLVGLILCTILYNLSYSLSLSGDSIKVAVSDIRKANDKLIQGEACEAALYAADSLIRVDSANLATMQQNAYICDSIATVIQTQRDDYKCALLQSEINVADMRTILAKEKQIARRRFWRGVGIGSGIAFILGGAAGATGAYYILH